MEALDLVADCNSCFGLCCVALAFEKSSDFAVDKGAGEPCVNLGPEFGCSIHARLRGAGYRGCTVYDCFGAGQKVSQVTFNGVSWRAAPETSAAMFASLPVMRQLHEMLWYLAEMLDRREATTTFRDELEQAYADTERLTMLEADQLLAIDVASHRSRVDPLLLSASALVRARHDGPEHRGADLVVAQLGGADLRGAHLRGALLIAADLAGADLRDADLIGADLRDADLAGADLRGALFLTQAQVNAAKGDGRTKLPQTLERPAHWSGR